MTAEGEKPHVIIQSDFEYPDLSGQRGTIEGQIPEPSEPPERYRVVLESGIMINLMPSDTIIQEPSSKSSE